jgi:hypothetical protein
MMISILRRELEEKMELKEMQCNVNYVLRYQDPKATLFIRMQIKKTASSVRIEVFLSVFLHSRLTFLRALRRLTFQSWTGRFVPLKQN